MFHPIYVSFTEINHNLETRTLQISTRIFTDDLTNAIVKESKIGFDIKNTDDKKTKLLVANYLKKHLKISVNSRIAPSTFIGYEIQGDVAWCYQEIKSINKVQKISIFNDLLYQLHDSQTNLVELKVNGESKTLKFQLPISLIESNF